MTSFLYIIGMETIIKNNIKFILMMATGALTVVYAIVFWIPLFLTWAIISVFLFNNKEKREKVTDFYLDYLGLLPITIYNLISDKRKKRHGKR